MALKEQTPADHPIVEPASSAASTNSEIIYTPPSTSPTSETSVPSTTMSPSTSASISIREYIYLMPYPFPAGAPIPYSTGLPSKNPLNLPTTLFEPTSTLVLTSPNKTFVDLRFYKPLKPTDTPLPNRGERERLEWGFAGSSASKGIQDPYAQPGEDKWEGVTYSKWTQFVDSRFPVGSKDIPIDEGIMYPISKDSTLEFGHMYHPSVEGVRTHEEMWFDPAVTSTSENGKKECVVLRCQDDKAGVRGVVVRLGKYCQGVVKRGDHTAVERWEWYGKAEVEEGREVVGGEEQIKWKRTARVGDLMVPCCVVFRKEVLKVGGKIEYGDYEWTVEEAWEWE